MEINIKEKENLILNIINDEKYTPLKVKELCFLLQVPDKEKKEFENLVKQMFEEGKIFITKKGNISSLSSAQIISGTFLGTARNFGFVSPFDKNINEIFIPPDNINGAMHKDKVFCRITVPGNKKKKDEGTIIKIYEKGFENIVGTFVVRKKENYVIPDNKKMSEYIRIPKNLSKGAVTDSKVIVSITNTNDKNRILGEVIEVLGHKNDPGVDILSIISQFDIVTDFPPDVLKQIEDIETEVNEKDLIGRRDLRNELIITIDGDDTKDVDDAVCVKKFENGNFFLGVYIADVTNYVKENSPLDKEALKRGTSVYLIDRVIPMLPYKLSNGICSLDENVDRLSLGCEMIIDNKGNLVSHEIFECVLNVKKKTTYNKVKDVLINEESKFIKDYDEIIPMLKIMEELSAVLREKRVQRGAIEFDFPEAKIIVDEDCHPIDIISYERSIATSIIEEFMLMCNETIAEEYFWLEIPFVFRTHEEPDSEKLETLTEFLKNFGYSLKGGGQHPKNLQQLLSKVSATPEENIISRVVLRSLKQARYTDTNFGHYGLAAKYYSHFTSPIRRYPDLQIHRIIKENINSGFSEGRKTYYESILPEVCKQSSKTERKAEEAEREVENLKKVEFMSDKIDEVFDAIISSVTRWGIYVTLPNTIEGMIQIDDLFPKDNYIFDEKHMEYVGHKKRNIYKLGDSVKVQLVRANIEERKLDFIIFHQEEE